MYFACKTSQAANWTDLLVPQKSMLNPSSSSAYTSRQKDPLAVEIQRKA